MTEQIKTEFLKELQIHQSVVHVIQNQLNGLLNYHEDLHLCMDDIQQYSNRFQEMKKKSEQIFVENIELKNLPKLQHNSSSKINGQTPQQQMSSQDNSSLKDTYFNLTNIQKQEFCFSYTKQDLQMKVCIQFLSFIHKNILASILASLVTIEKHIGVKDFQQILEDDVATTHVQCKKLLIILDYMDKWMEIDADKDCVLNPNLQKIVLNASTIQDISSNYGIDIDQQHSSFLNLIYSTYALIYEHGIEEYQARTQNISEQKENTQSDILQKEEQDKINYISEQNEVLTQEIQQKQVNLNQQNGVQRKKKTIGSFSMMYKSMKFLIKKQQAKKMTEKLHMNPTTDQIIDAWRMYEIVPEVKAMFSLQLDRINFSEKFYFPRYTKRIDLRYILQNANKYFSLPQNIEKQEAQQIQEKIEQCLNLTRFVPSYSHLMFHQTPDQYLHNLSTSDFISTILYKKDNFYQQKNSQGRATFITQKNSFLLGSERQSPQQLLNIRVKDKEQKIKVRFLSSTKLNVINDEKNENQESIFDKLSSIMCIGRNKISNLQNANQTNRRHSRTQSNQLDYSISTLKDSNIINKHIILHIHGGGFVSMNSFSHQIYTRKWANSIEECIVISVDYRKSPEHRYPSALDDIWQVYNFIIYHLEDVIENLHISSIILAGDSAGGNLCLSLMNLIVQEDLFRKPIGILLSYPALNLNGNSYTPSSLHSLKDVVLPPSFLKICLASYLPNTPEYLSELFLQYDTLLSPILIPDKILAQFPPIHIFCGEQDPLFDDSLRFFHRVRLLKDTVYQSVYQNILKQTKIQPCNDKSCQQNLLIDNQQYSQQEQEEQKQSDEQNKININSLQQKHQSAQLTIYPRLKHGYLNLDFPFGMPIVRNCVDQTITSLKTLLNQASINQNHNVSQVPQNIRSSFIRSHNSKSISDSLNSNKTEAQYNLHTS